MIVPGAGVLEAALPLRPWGVPYAMFLLSASGRLFGTKVALISVGASAISERATRWLFTRAARLAFYRSFRDVQSRELMSQQGVDTSADRIYPDLAFGIPTPPYQPGDPQTVGVGVMAYYGGNDDRRDASQIHAAYLAKMKRFTRWLVDCGYRVRLFGGDNLWDKSVVQEIVDDTARTGPRAGLGCSRAHIVLYRTDAGGSAARHGGRHPLSQRHMCGEALQAHHIARLFAEVCRPDGGPGDAKLFAVHAFTGR